MLVKNIMSCEKIQIHIFTPESPGGNYKNQKNLNSIHQFFRIELQSSFKICLLLHSDPKTNPSGSGAQPPT